MYFPGDPIPTELEPGSIGQKYFVAELGSAPRIEYQGDLPKNLGNKVSSTWRNTKGNHLAKVKAIQTTWGVFPIDPALDRYGFTIPPQSYTKGGSGIQKPRRLGTSLSKESTAP